MDWGKEDRKRKRILAAVVSQHTYYSAYELSRTTPSMSQYSTYEPAGTQTGTPTDEFLPLQKLGRHDLFTSPL